MKISDLNLALNAGYVYFYIQTSEHDRVIETINELLREASKWEIKYWDFERSEYDKASIIPTLDSLAYTCHIFKNLNWFLKDNMTREPDYQLVTYFQNHLKDFETRENRKAIIIVGNDDFENAIPNELKRDFITLDFELPTPVEIQKYLDILIKDQKVNKNFQIPSIETQKEIVDSCRGLTLKGARNALSFSLIKNRGELKPSDVGALRAQEIESTVGLKVGKYNVTELLGYENIKEFVSKSINSPISKGILIIGPPGTGKTHFCRYISSMSNKVMIEAELAEMQGQGLYGQAEAAWSNMIRTVKGIGNAILFFDEIEKGLSATSQAAATDSTGKRSASMLLKFMSDDREGIYIIATCNSIASLPPEYKRSERWDAIFYLGLPNEKELEQILKFYLKQYEVKTGNFGIKNMTGWSGAEIKTVCRIAKMMNTTLEKASKFVIPISKTMEREIKELETWAKSNAIPASIGIENNKKRAVEY